MAFRPLARAAIALFSAIGLLSTPAAAQSRFDDQGYLIRNGKVEGVQVTSSGLQYRETRTGTGAAPGPLDTVTVHYEGKLVDGSIFDSSYARGQPATFPLNRVIAGWTEGLQLMREGGEAELVIPSELGYGARGTRGIHGGATLIFKVELLKIE